ncbi:MAG: hypothetical protein A2X86_04520 [Bdellovibrionales bacterium GWA2_49_15]|nr:MAG: hypothetical protein A2X86_04520 [Bdellovibrionales bacterium GWA2_49_15]
MKKYLRFFAQAACLFLFIQGAFAEDFSDVDQRLRNLENTMNSMVDSIRIDIQDRTAKFPEYQEVFKDYLTRIDTGSTRYKSVLTQIKTFIETELTKVYSELKAIEDLQKQNPNSEALKRLLKDKRSRVEDVKKALIKQVNDSYQNSLRKLYTLEDKLVYPAKRPFNGRVLFWAINVVPFIGQMATLIPWSEMNSSQKTKINGRHTINNLNQAVLGCTSYYYGRCETQATGYFSKKEYKQQVQTASQNIYGSCKTAGCVYFIDEDFTHWTREFNKRINQDVRLMDGVVLKKIDTVSNGLAKKRLSQMADIAARSLPIAQFQ